MLGFRELLIQHKEENKNSKKFKISIFYLYKFYIDVNSIITNLRKKNKEIL